MEWLILLGVVGFLSAVFDRSSSSAGTQQGVEKANRATPEATKRNVDPVKELYENEKRNRAALEELRALGPALGLKPVSSENPAEESKQSAVQEIKPKQQENSKPTLPKVAARSPQSTGRVAVKTVARPKIKQVAEEGASKKVTIQVKKKHDLNVRTEINGGYDEPANDVGEAVRLFTEWSEMNVQQDAVEQAYSDAVHFLESKGVAAFWHMTHRDNVRSILADGILSHSNAHEVKRVQDISDPEVQVHRQHKESIYGRAIHDYAPLYINPRNPMLYKRKSMNADLCLVEVSLDVLKPSSDRQFLLTDGNAASRGTHFSKDLSDVKNLPWDVLSAEYWNDIPDGKRKRCAEVLIYPRVSTASILRVHCASADTLKDLGALDCPVFFSRSLFFWS